MELEARPEVTLSGTAWVVRSYNDQKQAVVSLARGTSLDASFGADGRLTGSAGCHRYTAGHQVEGDGIEIGPVAATRTPATPTASAPG
jgi:heat shock protein HslJ